MAAVFKENPMRTAAYAVAFIILAIVYVARIGSFATFGEATYALSIIVAVAIALAAGALALQRFRAEQRDAFLLISAGLWLLPHCTCTTSRRTPASLAPPIRR